MRSRSTARAALVLLLVLQVAGVEAETTDSAPVRVDPEGDGVARDVCDLVLTLWDSEVEGRRVSEPVTIPGSKLLDLKEVMKVGFGEDAMSDRDLWLDVSLRCPEKKGAPVATGRSRLQVFSSQP